MYFLISNEKERGMYSCVLLMKTWAALKKISFEYGSRCLDSIFIYMWFGKNTAKTPNGEKKIHFTLRYSILLIRTCTWWQRARSIRLQRTCTHVCWDPLSPFTCTLLSGHQRSPFLSSALLRVTPVTYNSTIEGLPLTPVPMDQT